MALRSIAVGIDASRAARDAASWADALATEVGAKLTTVRAWQMPLVAQLPLSVQALPSEEFMMQQTRLGLDRVIEESGVSEHAERLIKKGNPGPVLVEESRESDLLVVGRTGRGRRHGLVRLAEVVLGSTARYCVHHSTVPVAAVPRDARWAASPKVFVGVDGSDSSIEALRWALKNLPLSAEVHAVWALPYWTDGLIALDSELYQHAQQGADHELARCVATATRGDISLTAAIISRVEPGPARRVLTDAEAGIDVVVVGDRGRTGVAARVLGSVTDHVLRYAPCPVIVVPLGSSRF